MTNAVRIFLLLAVALVVPATSTPAAAPPISDPDGQAQPPAMPGTFPTTVTAANVDVEQFTPATLNGTNQNNLKVTFPAAGPFKWTESRHNEGDISMLIGPFDPNDPAYYPPNAFADNYGPIANGPFEKSTLAWRVNRATGAALATVRHNGVDYGPNYTFNGTPVGTIHGIAYMNESGSGWGYRTSDGVFANGGDGSSDLQMGVAGFNGPPSAGQGEANLSSAVAYFPYEQGWIGAWVAGADDGPATFNASSPGLPDTSVTWSGSQATVMLPGVNSADDGMLFVAPTDGDNNTNIAAAFPNAGGWTVSIREDDSATFDGGQASLVTGAANSIQFLYVPYSAPRLIGGHVEGSDGSLINSAGDTRFTLIRNAPGEYALSVGDETGKSNLTESDGMLILSVAGSMEGNPTFADRAFMSYEYDDTTGDFIIQSRHVAAINSPNSENQFGDWLELRDADFYFAWVDFENPLAPVETGVEGDYNDDGIVNAADYTEWRDHLGSTTAALPNDPTPELVDDSDFNTWKANFGQSSLGAGQTHISGAVPEPASLVLSVIAFGFVAAGAIRRAS